MPDTHETSNPQLLAWAQRLMQAEEDATPILPLSDSVPGMTIDEAYEVQQLGRDLRETKGERVVGRKIGLTSQPMQELLGVFQPDFGYLLESRTMPSGSVIETSRLIAPRVEAEIAFLLDRPLPVPDVTVAEILAATRAVAPALEVIDSRIEDWRITIVDTIADNASGSMAIVGEPVPVKNLDLRAVEGVLRVGKTEVRGRGEAVMGDPALAVAWLADAILPYGESLQAGDLLLSGAVATAIPVTGGLTASADFENVGKVEVSFS